MSVPEFSADYMKKRMHISWRGAHIAKAIDDALHPRSAVDLGCGTGDILAGLKDRQVEGYGIDSSIDGGACLEPWARFLHADIREPWETWGDAARFYDLVPVDLVVCLEVLSIVPEELDRKLILQNALCLGKSLLVNRTDTAAEQFLREHGWGRANAKTGRLRKALRDSGFAHKQAFKAVALTGAIWSPII